MSEQQPTVTQVPEQKTPEELAETCALCESKAKGYCEGCNVQEPERMYGYCNQHLNDHGHRMDDPCSACGDSQSDTWCEDGCVDIQNTTGYVYFCNNCIGDHVVSHEDD